MTIAKEKKTKIEILTAKNGHNVRRNLRKKMEQK
jgi:hypothetical protein